MKKYDVRINGVMVVVQAKNPREAKRIAKMRTCLSVRDTFCCFAVVLFFAIWIGFSL